MEHAPSFRYKFPAASPVSVRVAPDRMVEFPPSAGSRLVKAIWNLFRIKMNSVVRDAHR